jgi:hypothetical protein
MSHDTGEESAEARVARLKAARDKAARDKATRPVVIRDASSEGGRS